MTAPSFERVNYSIRTNKHIERRVVFERLLALAPAFGFADYRYIGFGSMWFVDFVLAHRVLGIRALVSIEESNPDRAEYNTPYACIDVRPGASGAVLDKFTDADWTTRSIVWLDYDGVFDEDARSDCSRLLERLHGGSIVLITANADRRSYRPPGPPDKTAGSITRLRELFGDAVPADALPVGTTDLTAATFPDVLTQSIINAMTGVVRNSGRSTEGMPDRFVPLFQLRHRDGVEMATVGGIVVSWRQIEKLESVLRKTASELFAGGGILRDVIDMVPITLKEKLAMDRLLPCTESEFAAALAKSGVRVDIAEAHKYRRLYNQFPVFSEMAT